MFLPKCFVNITLILICRTLSLVTYLGELFFFPWYFIIFMNVCYKEAVIIIDVIIQFSTAVTVQELMLNRRFLVSWVTSPSAMPPPVPCVLQAMSVLSKTKMSGEVSK